MGRAAALGQRRGLLLCGSLSLPTPRRGPWRRSASSSSTPAPSSVTEGSRPPRTRPPSWDPARSRATKTLQICGTVLQNFWRLTLVKTLPDHQEVRTLLQLAEACSSCPTPHSHGPILLFVF